MTTTDLWWKGIITLSGLYLLATIGLWFAPYPEKVWAVPFTGCNLMIWIGLYCKARKEWAVAETSEGSMPSDEAVKAAIEITKILQERYQLHDVPFGSKRIIDLLDHMMAQARLEEHKKCCRLIGQGYVPCCQEKPCIRRMDLERLAGRGK